MHKNIILYIVKSSSHVHVLAYKNIIMFELVSFNNLI